jgi:predicted nucleotidyltransferase
VNDVATLRTGRAGLDDVDAGTLADAVRAAADMVTDGPVALLTVAGSYLYGLADPGRSDLDLRGVYLTRTDLLLGLGRPAEQFQRDTPDLVVYEAGKVLRLAADGNANVLEILFSPWFVVCSDDGAELVAVRDACLSRRAVSRFVGYATAQHRAAVRIADGTDSGAGRFAARSRVKHVRHTFRLLAQAQRLAATGELHVTVEPALADELDALAVLDAAELTGELEARIAAVKAAVDTGPLPARPDLGRLDACLRRIRRRNLH